MPSLVPSSFTIYSQLTTRIAGETPIVAIPGTNEALPSLDVPGGPELCAFSQDQFRGAAAHYKDKFYVDTNLAVTLARLAGKSKEDQEIARVAAILKLMKDYVQGVNEGTIEGERV